MSSFTTPLKVEPLDNGREWRLLDPFKYHVGAEDSDEVIHVPADFVTDFASVPRAFWSLIPPWGSYGKAAVVHDYCYGAELYPRKRCDEIFLEAMTVLEVPTWKRQLMYRMVRAFGWISWRRHTKESIEHYRAGRGSDIAYV
jgi:hypothetical protein